MYFKEGYEERKGLYSTDAGEQTPVVTAEKSTWEKFKDSVKSNWIYILIVIIAIILIIVVWKMKDSYTWYV